MTDHGFAAGLIATAPADEYREKLMLYGQFVGNWLAEATELLPDGSTFHCRWDLRFQWILEGRAIQDLWISPMRDGAPISWHATKNRYSTTIRMYDPDLDAWHIVWLNPPGSYLTRQLARQVGDEIIQMADMDSAGSLTRWVYREITPHSFRWCNERSHDQGRSWQLVQDMQARRVA